MPGFIFRPLRHSLATLSSVAYDLVRLLVLAARSRRALAAENLYLRKQLALFQERKVKPRRAHDSTRLMMVILGRMFSWRDALVNVKPDTFLRWHRKGFRLLWRWKSRPVGRPRLPKRLAPTRPRDGRRESDLGRGAHCQRTEAQAEHSGLPAHRRQVPPQRRSRAHAGPETALADLRPESCQSHGGLRLLRGDHRHLPHPLRLRRHRDRIPQDSPPQRNCPSHGGMDLPAIPGSAAGRSSLPLPDPRSRQPLR